MPSAEEQKYGKYRRFFYLPSIGDAKKKGGSGTLKTGYFWTLLPLNLFEKHHVYMNIKIVQYFSLGGGGLIVTSFRVFGLKVVFLKF